MRPAISRNCRRTSWTMPKAARPTALIVRAAIMHGHDAAEEEADDHLGVGEVDGR